MQVENAEILSVIIIGGVLGLTLFGFIVSILFLYQKRQQKHEKELLAMKIRYDKVLLKSQLKIQEDTLNNISRELHDNIGSRLSLINILIQQINAENIIKKLDQFDSAKSTLVQVISDVSHLNKSMNSTRIQEIGLVEAIEYEVLSIKKSEIIGEINFIKEGYSIDLSNEICIVLFRMFQETLNNALKHSKASIINIYSILSDDESSFSLIIEDNGIGFNIEEKKGKHGVGIRSMKARAESIGATYAILSSTGKGSKVSITLSLPLAQNFNK